jgi:maleate isomerase
MDEPLALAPLRAYVEPPALDDAAELLAGGPVSAIAYAFTSTGYLAREADDTLRCRLERRTNGVPVITTCSSAVRALHALGARRMALIHPPWIGGELNDLGGAYFASHGFDVVMAASAGLPGGQRDLRPEAVFDWTRTHVSDDAEAVFFGGNGFRVVGAIGALEEALGRPVVSANQVLLWHTLRACGVRAASQGYGRIFGLDLPEEAP